MLNSAVMEIVDIVLVAIIVCVLIHDGQGTGSFTREANGEQSNE